MGHPYYIDGSNGPCLVREFIEKWDDSLFMRNGDIESLEVWVLLDDMQQHLSRRHLEVEVVGIDSFPREFF